jgi:hypothetical protein
VATPFDPLARDAGDAGEVRVAAEPAEAFRVAGFRVVVLRAVALRVVGFRVVDDAAVRRPGEAGFAVVAAADVALAAGDAGLAVDVRLVLGFADAALAVAGLAADGPAFVAAALARVPAAAARVPAALPADFARVAAALTRVPAAALARVPAARARVPVARVAEAPRVVAAIREADALALVPAPAVRPPRARVGALIGETAWAAVAAAEPTSIAV